jgi:hypothetical protein
MEAGQDLRRPRGERASRAEAAGRRPSGARGRVWSTAGFNPNSSYHLSIRVDYPNADDRAAARQDGRTNLGGDIFIHGKAVSIGCLALGDAAIEELYTLVADVGLARSRVLLTPNAAPEAAPGSPAWVVRLYERLRRELRDVRGTR